MPVPADQRSVSVTEHDYIRDDKGGIVPNPDSYARTIVPGANGPTSESFTDGVFTWTRTFSYTGTDLTGISQWVRT